MDLQIIVPFMQLTWKDSTQTYTVETVIPIDTRYHMVSETSAPGSNGQEIEIIFFVSQGYTKNAADGISHILRKFEFTGFPPPSSAGNLGASVTVTVYNQPYITPYPNNPLYKKKSKMRLAEAEVGVDPKVVY